MNDLRGIWDRGHERAYFLVGGHDAYYQAHAEDHATLEIVQSLQRRVWTEWDQTRTHSANVDYTQVLEKVLREKKLYFMSLVKLSPTFLRNEIMGEVERRAQSSAKYLLHQRQRQQG